MDLVQPMVGVQLDEHQPLMEYGIDSRRAMELCDAIEDSLGVEVPGTLVFNYPSIAAVVRAQSRGGLAEVYRGSIAGLEGGV
eukprot:1194974-Prorocentrum_minimum.AAC.1